MTIDRHKTESDDVVAVSSYKTEFLSICLLLALHPVTLLLDSSSGYFPPDAVQYMSFARDYLANGLLYLEFGNSNQGTVLPIVYPTLLLLANFFFDDMMLSAEMVSSIVVMLSSIPLYLIFRRFASNYFSIAGVLLVQFNYQLCLWAVTPLTEATFIFVLSWFVYLLFRMADSPKSIAVILLLGACTAVALLTRQIGLVLVPFALLILTLVSSGQRLKNYGGFAAGFLLLLLPYAVTLYAQTGQSIFVQQWSDREEVVLSQLPVETQEKILAIHGTAADDYEALVVNRRALRELVDDNSAMFEEVLLEPAEAAGNGLAAVLSLIWSEKNQYLGRLSQNISTLLQSLGVVLGAIFLLSLFTPLLVKQTNELWLRRYIVSGFVINYLFALSLVDALVDRYVLVLLPFILLNIAIESYHVVGSLRSRLRNPYAAKGAFAVLIIAFVFLQPSTVFDLELQAKTSESAGPFAPFRPAITQGDPVMALSPLYAYLVNGAWRIMPNDSVANIAEYAAREGVPWLLVVRGMSDADGEISYYQNAIDWYFDQELILKHQEHMELYAHSNDGRIVLFRFRNGSLPTP